MFFLTTIKLIYTSDAKLMEELNRLNYCVCFGGTLVRKLNQRFFFCRSIRVERGTLLNLIRL